MKTKTATLLAATLLTLSTTAGVAAAAPPELPGPPTHEHTMIVPGSGALVQVGPPASCKPSGVHATST